MSSIDQQFIEFVVKSLVNNPDAVQVERRIDEKGVLLELTVDPEDLGRVIGKRGGTAQSIRTLLRALGTKNDARYNLKIIDNGVGEHARTTDRPEEDIPMGGSAADDTASAPVAATVTKPLDDDTSLSDHVTPESDVVSKTRRELAELDDLDV
jgi:predicted RNA-binding protein YlqC (UPF0109 family)